MSESLAWFILFSLSSTIYFTKKARRPYYDQYQKLSAPFLLHAIGYISIGVGSFVYYRNAENQVSPDTYFPLLFLIGSTLIGMMLLRNSLTHKVFYNDQEICIITYKNQELTFLWSDISSYNHLIKQNKYEIKLKNGEKAQIFSLLTEIEIFLSKLDSYVD